MRKTIPKFKVKIKGEKDHYNVLHIDYINEMVFVDKNMIPRWFSFKLIDSAFAETGILDDTKTSIFEGQRVRFYSTFGPDNFSIDGEVYWNEKLARSDFKHRLQNVRCQPFSKVTSPQYKMKILNR
jgi:hypothetical protein